MSTDLKIKLFWAAVGLYVLFLTLLGLGLIELSWLGQLHAPGVIVWDGSAPGATGFAPYPW